MVNQIGKPITYFKIMSKNLFIKAKTKFVDAVLLLAFSLLTIGFAKAQGLYTTTASLVSAVNLAGTNGTGGTFILKDGTYNNATMSFSAIATAANPIIIKAQTIGGVTFTGTSYVSFGYGAAYMTLEGFKFTSKTSEESST